MSTEKVRSLCPTCRSVIEAKVFFRDGRVFMHKRCPDHGDFEALIWGDADLYQSITRFNRPGTPPKAFATSTSAGCPLDCGLCPDHRQHMCLGIIEVNQACNLDCPLCLADSGPHLAQTGFELTFEQVEFMLDRFVATEGHPEVIQFSGGEPTLHPRILDFISLAQDKGLDYVLLNTNGIRLARDDRFLQQLSELSPHIYLQFDGFDPQTYRSLRGRDDLLATKLLALDRLAEANMRAVLVAAIERGVNDHEVGRIVEFGLQHPVVFGVSFHSAFHAQRHPAHDPLQRVTTPDILKALEAQTNGLFTLKDFIPVPCCMPTCGFSTYAILVGEAVIPIPRVLEAEQYLEYVANRTMPALESDLIQALEALWSASAVPGSDNWTRNVRTSLEASGIPWKGAGGGVAGCSACKAQLPLSRHSPRELAKHIFMITTRDFMDPWTFHVEDVMKCCIGVLVPDGRAIPFCAYNSVGYREAVAQSLQARVLSPSM